MKKEKIEDDLPENKKERLVIASHTKGCTLDGYPAYISGIKERFATVSRADGRGGSIQYSWLTVQRVMNSDRGFKS